MQDIITIAREHGLELDASTLRWNESGLDFRVGIAQDASGQRWVLRVPRREDVLPGIARERATLHLINPRLSVDTPRWSIVTDELIAYEALPGVPSATVDPEAQAYVWELDPQAVPERYIKSLAAALVSLHAIPLDEAEASGMAPQTVSSLREARRRDIEQLRESFEIHPALSARWQRWLDDDALWPPRPAVVHGDLHAGHILIEPGSGEVTGFIDWTEAAISDPALDLLAHLPQFGEGSLDALIAAYGEAGGVTWPSMKQHIFERAAAFPIDIGLFALRSGREDMHQMATQMLGAPPQP